MVTDRHLAYSRWNHELRQRQVLISLFKLREQESPRPRYRRNSAHATSLHIAKLVLGYALITFITGTAQAEKLPKGAAALTVEDVKAIYSGHSSKWPVSNAWFAPDMSIKGIYGKKRDEAIFWGKWTAEGNEVCMVFQYRNLKKGDTGKGTDCWKWYRDGKKRLWTLWSKRFGGGKVPKNDYYRTEIDKLVPGDIVSEKFDKLKGG